MIQKKNKVDKVKDTFNEKDEFKQIKNLYKDLCFSISQVINKLNHYQ